MELQSGFSLRDAIDACIVNVPHTPFLHASQREIARERYSRKERQTNGNDYGYDVRIDDEDGVVDDNNDDENEK